MRPPKGTGLLIGLRGPRSRPVSELVEESDRWLNDLNQPVNRSRSIHDLKAAFAPGCRVYYSLAAASRRSALLDEHKDEARKRLFRLRSALERNILVSLEEAAFDVLGEAAVPSFFGRSQKQGVSVRYPLMVCVPTDRCGGGCYAHDGRDREIHHIFRGVLNYWLGMRYEQSGSVDRSFIAQQLRRTIDGAVDAAREDACRSSHIYGHLRAPRIRFAHVGEMVSTPAFLHFLADEVKRREPEIVCVLYTRHPNAHLVDTNRFVVNFSLESSSDPRRRFVPAGAKIVCSAWQGALMADADVNFPEHHVNNRSASLGDGFVCPVVLGLSQDESCDGAKCSACFVPSRATANKTFLRVLSDTPTD